MRHIQIVPGLRLRFGGRDEAFDEGVEIGLLAASMATGIGEFAMTLGAGTLEQARALAGEMGYRVHVVVSGDVWTEVMFLTGHRRPKLHVVRSDCLAASRA